MHHDPPQRTKKRLTPEQEVAIRQRVESGPTEVDQVCSLRGKDFQRILAEEFDVQRSLAAVYNLLHSMGYSYLRPRPIHRKSDPVAMEEFKQQWPEKLKSIAASHPDKQLRVYFQDESRFDPQRIMASREPRPMCGRKKVHAPRRSGRPSTSTCGSSEPFVR